MPLALAMALYSLLDCVNQFVFGTNVFLLAPFTTRQHTVSIDWEYILHHSQENYEFASSKKNERTTDARHETNKNVKNGSQLQIECIGKHDCGTEPQMLLLLLGHLKIELTPSNVPTRTWIKCYRFKNQLLKLCLAVYVDNNNGGAMKWRWASDDDDDDDMHTT